MVTETAKQIHVVVSEESYFNMNSNAKIIIIAAPKTNPDMNKVYLMSFKPKNANIIPKMQKIGTKTALLSSINLVILSKSTIGHPNLDIPLTVIELLE